MKPDDLIQQIEKQVVDAAKEELRARVASIRDPKTGEFPTVRVLGERLEDLRLRVEGSSQLLSIVQERLGPETPSISYLNKAPDGPKVFLSYASEDKALAGEIANGLIAKGIHVWWDNWEIRSGDSLRRKIDEGLGDCTHFVVLLTPSSLSKPWVQQEMDAGLVKAILGTARFIPLRCGLSALELPPLLTGMRSPEIDANTFEAALKTLVDDIHEISRKPEKGPAPATTTLPASDYSKAASAVARVFVLETSDAMFAQPQKTMEELAEATGLSGDDLADALHEIRDCVKVGFGRVLPRSELFAEFDALFMEWNPAADALRIAADLVNDPSMPHDTQKVADRYGWKPRRLNPALSYLMSRKLIVSYAVHSSRYLTIRVVKTDDTRRFVKSRS